MTRLPCPSCPWRVDQDATDIPHFNLDLAEKLAATCPDDRGMGPDFTAPQFACHQSRPGEEVVCAGWLAVMGHRHPAVRLAVALGKTPIEALTPPPGVALHDSFPAVSEKLRRTAGCRAQ
jgi:hypothetical protein